MRLLIVNTLPIPSGQASVNRILSLGKGLVENGVNVTILSAAKSVDTKFHDILYQASRNNRLVGIIYNLREQLTSFRAKSMAYPGRLEETLEEHRRIVDTIAQGDAVAAQKASEYHMERSEHTLLLSMEDKDGNM